MLTSPSTELGAPPPPPPAALSRSWAARGGKPAAQSRGVRRRGAHQAYVMRRSWRILSDHRFGSLTSQAEAMATVCCSVSRAATSSM